MEIKVGQYYLSEESIIEQVVALTINRDGDNLVEFRWIDPNDESHDWELDYCTESTYLMNIVKELPAYDTKLWRILNDQNN